MCAQNCESNEPDALQNVLESKFSKIYYFEKSSDFLQTPLILNLK